MVAAIGGKDPKQALDELAAEWDGLTEQIGVDRAEGGLYRLGEQAQRISRIGRRGSRGHARRGRSAPPRKSPVGVAWQTGRYRRNRLRRRSATRALFKYGLIAPAIFIMASIAVFPLFYLVVVSFQRLSLSDQITSFEGLVNYARIFSDARLWNAVLHTLFITRWRCRSNSCSACCSPTTSSTIVR